MEKDLGYNELLLLAKRLESRANTFAAEADEYQAKGMEVYIASQESSIQQAEETLTRLEQEYLVIGKKRIAKVDKDTSAALLHVYGEYGLKES